MDKEKKDKSAPPVENKISPPVEKKAAPFSPHFGRHMTIDELQAALKKGEPRSARFKRIEPPPKKSIKKEDSTSKP